MRTINAISPEDTTDENLFDIGLFTNTDFLDLDSGQTTDFQVQPGKADVAEAVHESNTGDVAPASSVIGNMHFDMPVGDFNFPDFSTAYPAPSLNAFAEPASAYPPLQPSHGSVYANQVAQQHQQQQQQQQAHYSQDSARPGEKRKAETVPPTPQSQNFEDASRMAAEEDKRRRNTAASARFRIKKKQREQALEKSAKEMSAKVSSLESRVSQLETENKWLKNLLVEKNEGNEDIVALWKEFAKQAGGKLKQGSSEPVKDER